MVLLRIFFDLRKSLKDFSAEQETVGVTLRLTAVFPKLHCALSPKKIG